jgi:3-oxoacyl-[acyl-carrier-protein] synthase II
MFAGMRTIAEFDRRALEAGPQYVMPLDFANTVFNAAAGQTAIRFHLTGPNATLGGGPVAGLQALGYAADLVRSGQARAILAGGMDELSSEALHAFARAGMLSGAGGAEGVPVPFDGRRDGCALGEGAVLFMVESIADAERRGAPILAEIVASASAWAPPPEPAEPDATDETALALARVIDQVFAQADLRPSALDAWSASASGAVARDRSEARGFAAAMGADGARIAVTAVKGALGETLGAAGGLQALALLEAMRTGRLPGIAGLAKAESDLGITLSADDRAVDLRLGLATAVGFDGAVEALLLRRWEGETSATR